MDSPSTSPACLVLLKGRDRSPTCPARGVGEEGVGHLPNRVEEGGSGGSWTDSPPPPPHIQTSVKTLPSLILRTWSVMIR